MLRNYFKIAVRNLTKNKVFSLINILGLSVGIACCLLLALYIQDEFSYDKHHKDGENLYRIITEFKGINDVDRLRTASPPIALALKEELEDVSNATRALNPPGVSLNLIKYEDNTFYEKDGLIADSTLFDVLNYQFIEGNPNRALVEPNSVVLLESMAKKLFGDQPALNKVIFISQGGPSGDFKVTGVVRELGKSHLDANFFVSMTSSGWAEYMRSENAQGEWAGQNFVPSYLRLIAGHNLEEVTRKMNEVLVKYGSEDMKALGFSKTLSLEPVEDIYLKSDVGQNPRITYVYVISTIAIFILLIACINFMNLSTAKATKRASEVGIRKVMGAFRSSLISQLLGEAMVLVMISIAVSVALIYFATPFFNELTNKNISFGSENIFYFGTALITITIITGLIAGSYPAFYLSSFQPAQVLKGKFDLTHSSGKLRQSLVVFQFAIGIALVCGMLIINKQLTYMQNESLGFNPDAKIVLPLRTESAQRGYKAFRNELSREAGITAISAADYMPGTRIFSDFSLYPKGGNMDGAILHRINNVDAGYIELIGVKMLTGRSFSDNREQDSNNKVIINKVGALQLGFTPEQAIGQDVFTEWQGEKITYQIIGVMNDYHQMGLKQKIEPVMFRLGSENRTYDYAILNIETKVTKNALTTIEAKWNQLQGDTPFEFSFLNDDIQKQYSEDQKVSSIITSFTLIAMLIRDRKST
ncbi:MAG: ABC transporter permease, partial [Cyclobacteriaceae bacterium]